MLSSNMRNKMDMGLNISIIVSQSKYYTKQTLHIITIPPILILMIPTITQANPNRLTFIYLLDDHPVMRLVPPNIHTRIDIC